MKTKLLNLVTGAALTIPLLIHIFAYAELEENEAHKQQEPPAMQDESAIESQIEGILTNNPGSYQISPTEVQLSNGAVMKVDTLDVQGCPTNSVCLSEHADFEGEQLSYSNCSPQVLAESKTSEGGRWNDRVSSMRNAKVGGYIATYTCANPHTSSGCEPVIDLPAGRYLRDLREDASNEGGNANDKIDLVLNVNCPE